MGWTRGLGTGTSYVWRSRRSGGELGCQLSGTVMTVMLEVQGYNAIHIIFIYYDIYTSTSAFIRPSIQVIPT